MDFESKDPSSNIGRTSFSLSQKLQCSFVCLFSLEKVERLSPEVKQNTSTKFNSFYNVEVSTLDFESKDPSSNIGRTSFSLSQKLQCSFVCLFSLEKVERLSPKVKQNTSRRFNRFYGVVVSTLDSESKDPSSNLGRTFFLCQKNSSVVSSMFVFSRKCRRVVEKLQRKHKH